MRHANPRKRDWTPFMRGEDYLEYAIRLVKRRNLKVEKPVKRKKRKRK